MRLREAAGTGTAGAERSVAGKRRNFVSADQITYVLIAFIVTGVAILLLLVGALLGRRGRGEARSARPADESAAPVAAAAPPPAACPTPRACRWGPTAPLCTGAHDR